MELRHWVVELLEKLTFFFCMLIAILKAVELIGIIAPGFGAQVPNTLSVIEASATALANVELSVPTRGAHVRGFPSLWVLIGSLSFSLFFVFLKLVGIFLFNCCCCARFNLHWLVGVQVTRGRKW